MAMINAKTASALAMARHSAQTQSRRDAAVKFFQNDCVGKIHFNANSGSYGVEITIPDDVNFQMLKDHIQSMGYEFRDSYGRVMILWGSPKADSMAHESFKQTEDCRKRHADELRATAVKFFNDKCVGKMHFEADAGSYGAEITIPDDINHQMLMDHIKSNGFEVRVVGNRYMILWGSPQNGSEAHVLFDKTEAARRRKVEATRAFAVKFFEDECVPKIDREADAGSYGVAITIPDGVNFQMLKDHIQSMGYEFRDSYGRFMILWGSTKANTMAHKSFDRTEASRQRKINKTREIAVKFFENECVPKINREANSGNYGVEITVPDDVNFQMLKDHMQSMGYEFRTNYGRFMIMWGSPKIGSVAHESFKQAEACRQRAIEARRNAAIQYADEHLASQINAAANAGGYGIEFDLPVEIDGAMLKTYLVENGFTLTHVHSNHFRIRW